MKKNKRVLIALALLTASFIAACGGGGGSAGGGIGGTGKAVGAIDGFGSIFVNGVEFETGTATVRFDDNPGVESDLKLGMVVEVEGEFNDDGVSGTAAVVSYDDVVEGPVTSAVNTTTKSFAVMGQTVFYTANTVFEISGGGILLPTDLNAGTPVVEVSGIFDSAGQIRATRVERKSENFIEGDLLEVKGRVANLDTTDETFDIGALAVNYSAVATSFDNGTINDLAEGVLVEVKGDDDPSVGGLDADRIEFEFEDFGNDGDLLEFEGYVTSIVSTVTQDFVVGDLPVLTNGQTQWRGGYTQLVDVALDDKVEVEGTLQDQGGTLVLVAREVELDVEDNVRIEGPVQAVNSSTNVLSIISLGVAYSDTLSVTRFEDKDAVNIAVDDVDPGAWVRIEGVLDPGGNVSATRIEQDDGDTDLTRIILEGPAAGTPGPSGGIFTILGVTIDRQPDVQYRIEDAPVSATVFFTNLTDGRFVKARGTFAGTTLTAEELDLQN
ncbi:MAG: hypothetical protein JSV70_06110 [bacterium]|nr:MAG: hypothetical protein JSV70_06110 [bacterium]